MAKKYVLGLFLTATMLLGCSNPAVTISSAKTITFNIQIDKKVLSNKRDLEAKIYNEEQKKTLDATAGCTVSFDITTGKETINCPAGVVYKQVTPETFSFKVDDIKESINLKSNKVKTGQKYLITLSGLSSDNCNTASARVEKTAEAELENIKDLQWMQTEMGCLN